ncbi:MAG: hypothetical protein K9J16_01840 [Melioribacteraceae bacterium]|nr:hypothetical protein [Melioribacteraceae bacterium]MCF8353007.1 hypothetical protein [Melioribacteraceae bacterium]MCF8392898.1 hypothetical protein [Melioribacteraceae bacterium]MCF8417808.1 hypothetical protein [Melioribacteraceae bacterium]
MTKSYLKRLFNYNFYMNHELINALINYKITDEFIQNVLAHFITTEKIWLSRLKDEDLSGQIIWPDLTFPEAKDLAAQNESDYNHYFENITDEDLCGDLNYINSKGEAFSTNKLDILNHVIIHGGYHRGQINAALRKLGYEPIKTDYIHYVRTIAEKQ